MDNVHDTDASDGLDETESVLVGWSTRVKLLSNPQVWSAVGWAFGVTAALVAGILCVVTQSAFGLVVGGAAFAGLMVLYVITGVFVDLFGGFDYSFALTTRGVRSLAGKGPRAVSELAFWAGVLGGKPGTAGAGLLAASGNSLFIPYADVHKVVLRPRRRYAEVKAELLDQPIGLFCTEETYAQVERILREKCAGAKFAG